MYWEHDIRKSSRIFINGRYYGFQGLGFLKNSNEWHKFIRGIGMKNFNGLTFGENCRRAKFRVMYLKGVLPNALRTWYPGILQNIREKGGTPKPRFRFLKHFQRPVLILLECLKTVLQTWCETCSTPLYYKILRNPLSDRCCNKCSWTRKNQICCCGLWRMRRTRTWSRRRWQRTKGEVWLGWSPTSP